MARCASPLGRLHSVHRWTEETERLSQAVLAYTRDRMHLDPVPLDRPLAPRVLLELAGQTITRDGLGGDEALRIFRDVLAQATISIDHPRFLAFIPSAPTEVSMLFDLVVSASSTYGGSWLEGAGAVFAENQALRFLADVAGFPAGAGGCFVSGGTLGNLAALVAAREVWLDRRGGERPARLRVAASVEAHSSVPQMARVIDAGVLPVAVDAHGRVTGATLRAALAEHGTEGLFGVVATCGTTNLGIIDDLAGVADVCAEHELWFHVDGAYGAAALVAPSARAQFAGIERADSFIVDPHKWLFAPFDCCALVYRDPELARRAHTQHAGYLEVIETRDEWNPSDYAVHLSRRARGLPFWFSLAVHGTKAYEDAVETTLAVARSATEEIRSRPELELVHEPMLSVVGFKRLGGEPRDYTTWSEHLLADGYAFVTPSTNKGETITRFAIVNPRTSMDDIRGVLDTMR